MDIRQILDSDFVLTVCTETYKRRVMGEEEPGKGQWGAVGRALINPINQYIYDAGDTESCLEGV
jgi:hypothetical protein